MTTTNTATKKPARTIRTSKALALAKIDALLEQRDRAATMAERADLDARIWAVREIAGLR